MDPILSYSGSGSESDENISNIEQADNHDNIEQLEDKRELTEDSIFSDTVILIAKIAIPIIIAVVLFAAIPFVGTAGAIGLGLTGLFFIALGIYSMLTGEGLAKLKAWGEVQQAEADKAKQKQNVDLINQKSEGDASNSDSDSFSVDDI
ncbi:MAG: hypothetical protein H0T62_10180 [Parachlamydiaceae bacterium]|nr:hypothetical protein [Parachlamydiaceae bacterium]